MTSTKLAETTRIMRKHLAGYCDTGIGLTAEQVDALNQINKKPYLAADEAMGAIVDEIVLGKPLSLTPSRNRFESICITEFVNKRINTKPRWPDTWWEATLAQLATNLIDE